MQDICQEEEVMRADYIQEIVNKFEELPYECILFDGVWGIGKTYAIDEALKEQENVCRISMFGLKNSQQIYHEVLFQSILKSGKAGKVGEFVSDFLTGIASVWESAAQARDMLESVVKEKELFLLASKTFDSLHIIIIDDLERISDTINLEVVLGIVEELKSCNYVKVILVANTKELNERNQTVFEKYAEKVIDRIYNITERPEKINWGAINIHAGFMQEFLSIHKVKNLRTLQKAQKFYDDVKLYCSDIKNKQFLDEIRLICFAIVVESTDNLYYKEPDENETDNMKKMLAKMHNELESRVSHYLYGIKCGKNVVQTLIDYYNNGIIITSDNIKTEYEIFLQAGNKPNYYKDDEEIRRMLPLLREAVSNSEKLSELNRCVDEYMVWSDIIGEDNIDILEAYKSKVYDMLLNDAKNGNDGILGLSYDLWYTSSEKVMKVYEEQKQIVKVELVHSLISYLVKTTDDEQAYLYSKKLREHFQSSYYRDIIVDSIQSLYNDISFPIGSIGENQYHTCYNIMYLLYHADKDKYLQYCEELVKRCDKMSAHRIDILTKEIMKGY